MQRITNCVLLKNDEALLLQKPSKLWWVAPGGKMEPGETILEAATREFREETGLAVKDIELRAVSTVVITRDDQPIDEWMMFTFQANEFQGQQLAMSPEGHLEWKKQSEVCKLPMAEGDSFIFKHIFQNKGILYGTFYYTEDFKLTSYRLEPAIT